MFAGDWPVITIHQLTKHTVSALKCLCAENSSIHKKRKPISLTTVPIRRGTCIYVCPRVEGLGTKRKSFHYWSAAE